MLTEDTTIWEIQMRSDLLINQMIMYTFLFLIIAVCPGCSKNGTPTGPEYLQPVLYDFSADWSPRGDWIAFIHGIPAGEDNGLYIIRPDGSERTLVFPEGVNPRWSHDGETIVAQSLSDNQIYLVDPFALQVEKLTTDSKWKNYPSWNPNGERITFGVYPGTDDEAGIWEFEIDSRTYNKLLPNRGFSPTWDNNGERLLFIRGFDRLSIWTVSDSTIQDLISRSDIGAVVFRTPRFSPDGSSIFFRTQQRDPFRSVIWIHILSSESTTPIIMDAYDPTISPDGKKLAFSRPRSNENPEVFNGFIWIMDIQTGEFTQVSGK